MSDITSDNINVSEEPEFNFSDVMSVALSYWKWYVISVFICLFIAFIYIKRSPNVYQRQATVMIKSEKGSSQLESEASAFEDLGIMTTSKSVDNELLVFKTKRLMIETCRRLHLDVDYSREGHFRSYNLYAETPYKLNFPDAKEKDQFAFVMTPEAGGKIHLHDFVTKDGQKKADIYAQPGVPVKTPVGRVIAEVNHNENREALTGVDINVRKYELKAVGLSYAARLQTALASKLASIITLTMQDVSKERAEDVLNTLVEVYNEDAIEDKNKVVVNTDKFINERLKTLEGELGSVDMTIANFKSSHQLTDISADAAAFRNSFSLMEQQSADLENQKAVAQYLLNHIANKTGESRYDVIPNNTGVKNTQVENLISQYNTLTLQREKIMRDAGANNPQVEDLSNNVDQLRTRIVASIRNLVHSLNIEIANNNARVDDSSNRLTAVPTQQKTVTNVERQQRIKENLYMYLLNKREANNLKKNMAESNARVLDPAEGSDAPVAPRSFMIYLLGIIIGLAIPSVFLWFAVSGNTKIRSRKDIEGALSVPFLGEIPEVEDESAFAWFHKLRNRIRQKQNKRRNHLDIVVTKESQDPVSEAIRILRTNLHLMKAGDDSKKVIMMTSYIPSAGKTFVSSNLAMSMALTHKKVVIVDTDIRRGSLSAQYGRKLPGVTNYLGGYTDDIDEITIHSDKSEYLDIIPAGVVAPNPAELLLLPRLEELIDKLKAKYDYVILDNVPANVVADAAIVNRVADITIFVIRAGNLDRRMLPDVQQLQDSGKFKNMCVVLNGVSKAQLYTSYYGYGYHKYYGYGY